MIERLPTPVLPRRLALPNFNRHRQGHDNKDFLDVAGLELRIHVQFRRLRQPRKHNAQ